MSYNKVHVEKFTGLNSSVAPELLPDGAARDLLNFRQEKVGKLTSRNGVVLGLLYTNNRPTIIPDYAPAWAYYDNKGVVGIGEYVLSEYWEDFDTDRFMVYAVRAAENADFVDYDDPDFPIKSQKFKMAYLFAPMSGTMQDRLVIMPADPNYSGIPTYEMDSEPNGDMEVKKTLYAANRDISDVDQPSLPAKGGDHWIDRYVHFNQFRSKLVISDRINGDMLLEDDFDRADLSACDTPEHKLRLRPNCVDDFDIDNVTLDPRLAADEENDASATSEGVVNGMGLYKFILPKKTKKPTDDHFANLISNPEWTGWEADKVDDTDAEDKYKKVVDFMYRKQSSTLFNLLWARENNNTENRIFWQINHDSNSKNHYCFSNTNVAEEFDDLLAELEFPKDEFVDQDTGKVVKQVAPDVYVWEDYRIPYYPCSGKTLTAGHFLTDNDRDFDKLQIGIPRALDLTEKLPGGKDAPLGVWRYRFVWDFGGGIYSAPSSEMLCPDLLWSATKDSDVQYLGAYGYYRNKHLKVTLNDYNTIEQLTVQDKPWWEGQYMPREEPYALDGKALRLITPAIFEGSGVDAGKLTTFGEKFFDLKLKLYKDLNHKYGVKSWQTINDVNAATMDLKGDFGVLATVFFSNSSVETSGFIWEGVATRTSTSSFSFSWELSEDPKLNDHSNFYAVGSSSYANIHSRGKLVVPIFQTNTSPCSHNSLFDDNGKLRLAYASDPADVKIQLMFPGFQWGLVSQYELDNLPDTDPAAMDFRLRFSTLLLTGVTNAAHDPNIYLNITCLNDVTANLSGDENNLFIDYARKDRRPHTILRAVNTELDKLIFTVPGIDTEALNRLLLQGVAEIHVCSPLDLPRLGGQTTFETVDIGTGDPITWTRYDIDEPNRLSARQAGVVKTFTLSDPYGAASDSVEDACTVDDNFNLDVYIYGTGERFTGVEQLSTYFPSSLLFEAPRIAIKIPYDKIPARAKRLLIFRSKASHSNEFQANEYGLVETVELYRDPNTNQVKTNDYKGTEDYDGMYFFDDIKDRQLDFGVSPDEYEGLREPIRSALNIPINERMYYLNYKQSYQPIAPRKYEAPSNDLNLIKNFTYRTERVDSTDEGFDTSLGALFLRYKFVYKDANGIFSHAITVKAPGVAPSNADCIELTSIQDDKWVVVFFYVPSTFEGSLKSIEVYREIGQNNQFYKIGEVLPEDEGIFVDNYKENGQLFECDEPIELSYESGIMYSKPYYPNWIRPENVFEVRSGDGKQITAAHSLDGNLLIFKETSMHRIAIQGTEPPMSRVDEVNPSIGCIAKNANINVDNIVYFLSNKGFMMYDNNKFQKIDGPFDEELQFVLAHASESDIRDISCGFNPYFNEIYLNIPMLRSSLLGPQFDYGSADYIENRNNVTKKTYYQKTVLGHIYVINLEKQYATKFAYVPTLDMDLFDRDYTTVYREVKNPNQLMRLYYTNSLGQMRSADIHPIRHKSVDNGKVWAGIYGESPYKRLPRTYIYPDGSVLTENYPVFMDTDEILSPFVYVGGHTFVPMTEQFPYTEQAPYRVIYKSKFFTGEDESIIKRVRNVITNIFSRGPITIKGISIARETDAQVSSGELPDGEWTFGDDRIENVQFDLTEQTFNFNPTINAHYPLVVVNGDYKGTGSNVLECVLQTPLTANPQRQNDWLGKPVRFSVETESSLRTQLNAVSFNWRPIHTYLH